MRKSFLVATVLGFAAAFWFFRLPYSYGRKLTGFIIAVLDNDKDEIVIRLNNDTHDFIITSASDLGIDIKRLQSKLIGKRTMIWITHPKWPVDTTPHITKLVCEGEVVYSKW